MGEQNPAPAATGSGVREAAPIVLAQALPGIGGGAPAPAAKPIGRVESIEGAVRSVAAGQAALRPGSPVHQGEVIETGPDGRLLIRFEDGTTLSTGPGARLVLDELVYDPAAGKASFVLSVLKGTFLYVTGLIAGSNPEGVEVRTPAGTIGIRGTAFGCVVDSGTVCVLLEDPDGKVGKIAFKNAVGQRIVDQVFESVGARDALSPPSYARLSSGAARDLLLPGLERSSPIEPAAGPGDGPRTGGGADFAGLGEGVSGSTAALGVLGPQDPTEQGGIEQGGVRQPPRLETTPRVSLAAASTVTHETVTLGPGIRDFGGTVALPALANGVDLLGGAAFERFGLSLFGDPAALTVEQRLPYVDLRLSGFGAAFQSALGAYVVGADGRIGQPVLVAPNIADVPVGTSFRLDPSGEGLRPGETLGLFLLADGFTLNPALRAGGTPVLAFRETAPGGLVPGAPDVADTNLELVLVDGRRGIVLEGSVWHTTAHVGGLPIGGGAVTTRGLNADDPGPGLPRAADGGPITQHHVVGLAGDGRLLLGFEDSPLAAGDRDFQDVVVELEFPPAVTVAATDGAFRFGFSLGSRTGELVGLAVTIAGAPAGAKLALGPGLALGVDGEVLVEGAASGVRLVLEGDGVLRFAADRPLPAASFEAIANGLALVGEGGSPAPGTYALRLEASEPGGDVATLPVRFVVPEAPLVGSPDRDDRIGGGAGSDVLFGLGGDDRLEGGGGDDILVGGPGRDVYLGGKGADIVRIGVVTALDRVAGGEPLGPDRFLDFRAKDGDLIDLSPLLGGTGFAAERADRFVRFVRDEAVRAVEIQVDPDGTAGAAGWRTALVVEGTVDSGLVAARTLLEV